MAPCESRARFKSRPSTQVALPATRKQSMGATFPPLLPNKLKRIFHLFYSHFKNYRLHLVPPCHVLTLYCSALLAHSCKGNNSRNIFIKTKLEAFNIVATVGAWQRAALSARHPLQQRFHHHLWPLDIHVYPSTNPESTVL